VDAVHGGIEERQLTAASPAPTRNRRGRLLAVAVVLLLAVGLPFYSVFSPSWESRVYDFPRYGRESDFRVRIVESAGRICAELREEKVNTRDFMRWMTRGKDCAWPAVAGADAWLAGGQAHQPSGTRDRLFYGIAPAAAAEVRLTLSTGAALRIPTKAAGEGGLRVYAHYAPDAGDAVTVTAVRVLDASGGELRVL
jgi:hypothetical protein